MKFTVVLMRPAHLTAEDESFRGVEHQDIVVARITTPQNAIVVLSEVITHAQLKASATDGAKANWDTYTLVAIFDGHPNLVLQGKDT